MTVTIGAYEAKTHLSQILDEVAAGRTYSITKHDREVALLVPPIGLTPTDAVEALRQLRQDLRLEGLSTADLVADGRRW